MLDANPVAMPMDPNIKLAPNPDNNELNHSNSYAKLLGCLQFISNSTRPDISFAVNKLAAYTANPGLQHHGAIKQILRYLAGMKTLGITYMNTPDETDPDTLFHGYANATFTNTDDHKSTTGLHLPRIRGSDHMEIKEANHDHAFLNRSRICGSLRGWT
jgi:hypothetical protein